MESDKIYLHMTQDKLYGEYNYFTEGKKYVTYEHYLKPRGLTKFKSVLIDSRPLHEYTVIDWKQYFLTKIKYGL